MIFFLILIFFIFGALQLNDPDPLLWTSIYWGHCIVLGCVFKRYLPSWTLWMLGIICAVVAILLWPSHFYGLSGNMDQKIEIEEARESLGLILISASQFGVAWLRSRSS